MHLSVSQCCIITSSSITLPLQRQHLTSATPALSSLLPTSYQSLLCTLSVSDVAVCIAAAHRRKGGGRGRETADNTRLAGSSILHGALSSLIHRESIPVPGSGLSALSLLQPATLHWCTLPNEAC